MGYPVFCIIPNGRYLNIEQGIPLISQVENIYCSENKVMFYPERGESSLVSLFEIGEIFGFDYAKHISFLHEKDLRNLIIMGIDVVDNEHMNIGTGFGTMLEAGELCNDISLRFVGNVNNIAVGYGLYAEHSIRSGVMIGEYSGLVVSSSVSSTSAYSLTYPSPNNDLEINASETGNLIRFVNHSEAPNCEFCHYFHERLMHVICVSRFSLLLHQCTTNLYYHICLRTVFYGIQVSIQDIAIDEQLTVNYGASYWTQMDCKPVRFE